MRNVTLSIYWRSSTETIELDLDTPPSQGHTLTTFESWTDAEAPVVYRPEVRTSAIVDGTLQLILHYEPVGDLDYGTSEIFIPADLNQARAYWTSEDDPAGSSGAARKCRIEMVEEERDVELGTSVRILRPGQAALRAHLLRIDNACALSGASIEAMLDVAHIVHVRDKGPDIAKNAILLRADLHRLFDAGFFTLDEETGRVKVKKPVRTALNKSGYGWLNPDLALDGEILKRVRISLQRRNDGWDNT